MRALIRAETAARINHNLSNSGTDVTNPYSGLKDTSYWRSGVAEAEPEAPKNIYQKKFAISPVDRIVTAGSCFAQHVARNLRSNGYNVVETEKLPSWLPPAIATKYGYGLYSARYGNIYTVRQLLQLIEDCQTGTAREEDVWEKDGRYYDALRPSVEPEGLDSIEEVLEHRRAHLKRVQKLFLGTDVFIFTLGLTEAWQRLDSGVVYPTCPGVIAGTFDPAVFGFVNFNFFDVYGDLVKAREMLLAIKPDMRFLFTVSPVPLTATASGDHVLVATTRSKSTLRAACSVMADEFANVDYFPSFEIITSPNAHGQFYESNLRSVTEEGVATVMRTFFTAFPPANPQASETSAAPSPKERKVTRRRRTQDAADVVCEDALLEAFSK